MLAVITVWVFSGRTGEQKGLEGNVLIYVTVYSIYSAGGSGPVGSCTNIFISSICF